MKALYGNGKLGLIQFFVGSCGMSAAFGQMTQGHFLESLPLFFSGLANAYYVWNFQKLGDTRPAELKDLDFIKVEYRNPRYSDEPLVTKMVNEYSVLCVENVKGVARNVRTTGNWFKKTLVDLVDTNGESVLCVLPKNTNVKDGQQIEVDAWLTKVETEDKLLTGLKAYAVA